MKDVIIDKENIISKLSINKKLSDNNSLVNKNIIGVDSNAYNKSDSLNISNKFNIPLNFSEKRRNYNIPMMNNVVKDFSLRTNLNENRNLSNMSDNLFFNYEDSTNKKIKNDHSQIQLLKENNCVIPGLENNYYTQKNTKLNHYKNLLFAENLNKDSNSINNNLTGNDNMLNNINVSNKL